MSEPSPRPLADGAPAPPWLLARFLQPGEEIVWSRAPRLGPWREWALKRHPGLGIVFFLGFFAFPLLGAAIVGSLGGDAGIGVGLGAPLGFASAGAGVTFWALADKHICHVLTDRRFLIIKNMEKVEELDVELLRRLLDGTKPAESADERVQEAGKVRAFSNRPPEGVAELQPLLELVRQFGQLQPKP